MQISVASTNTDLTALAPAWRALHARARHASIFNSWEWLSAWWEHYGQNRQLYVLVVREDDSVVGILPAYVEKTRVLRMAEMNVMCFLGTGGDTAPDDLDALIDPDREKSVAAALAGYVFGELKEWDALWMTDMAADSVLRAALQNVPKGRFWKTEGVSARIGFLHLPESWEAYLESLTSFRRKELRRFRRKFNEQTGAKFYVWKDAQQLDTAIDRLVALHHLRWHGRVEHYSFSSKEYVDFHRRVMHACMANDWLRLYCLEVNGEIIAIDYCYRFRDQIFDFQRGFDPAYMVLGPGSLLTGYVIDHAMQEGNRIYDMLRGEYDYKTLWVRERRETHYFRAYRLSPATVLYCSRYEWFRGLRRLLARCRSFVAKPAGGRQG